MGKYGEGGPRDFSDWGRPIARYLALYLKDSPVSVMQVTNIHFILTLFCGWLILQGQIVPASILLVIKGVVDAIDGELARIRQRPSHVGRYWDTIADAIGLVVVMFALGTNLKWGHALSITVIIAVLFQYSLFNHFSLRLRILGSGDTTSRLDERTCPRAYPWEKQKNVERLHRIYLLIFAWQDSIITALTGRGTKELRIELTSSSILGFGFQSLILASIAIVDRIELLPEIVLVANNAIFVFAILCSRFGATTSR